MPGQALNDDRRGLDQRTAHLDGACDIFLITNGEGGFKYSTLAESIYGVELTEEGAGRWYLPSIRRMELLQACKVLNVRNVWFMTQRDHRYTQDPLEVLADDAGVWDLEWVRTSLTSMCWCSPRPSRRWRFRRWW